MKAQRRCPQEFSITLSMRQWAKQKVPGLDIDEETEAMKDHEFVPGRTDWEATWRNWMRRSYKFQYRFKQPEKSVQAARELVQSGEMAQLIARLKAPGFAGCREPIEGETVSQYRAMQDKYWLEQREKKVRLVK